MKKRIWCILLSLCMVLSLLPVTAGAANVLYSGTCGESATWVITDDGVMTISGTGTVTSPLPQEGANERNKHVKTIVVEEGITAIDSNAFVTFAELEYPEEALYLPDSLESIGENAFAGHRALREIHFGNGLTDIGSDAFMHCSSLQSLELPDSLLWLGTSAFSGCTSLKTVVVPGSVQELPQGCFSACSALESVVLQDGIRSIGMHAFGFCSALKEIQFPTTLTELNNGAFYGCTGLETMILPYVSRVPDQCFKNCTGLTTLVLADGTSSIGADAFAGCAKLETVYLPDSVALIDHGAFSSCGALKEIRLPTKLLVIPESMFAYCTSLESVIFSNTTQYIEKNAFTGCLSLQDVYYAGTESELGAIQISQTGNNPLFDADVYLIPAMPDPVFGFFDMPARNNWAYPGIAFCLMNGLMNGMGGGYFQPAGTTTRAQLVTILWRMMDEPKASSPAPFTDLKQDWYREAVAWAAENGITNGTSATTFSPDTPVTREQMVTIFYRMCRDYLEFDVSPSVSLESFPDSASVSPWAQDAMQWAVAVKLISGVGDGKGNATLQPKGSATRAQIATVMLNFVNAFSNEFSE